MKTFGADFYPTPFDTIEQLIAGLDLHGKTILEPSAGSGAILSVLAELGANVLGCEINPDLAKIAATKCKLIASDFLTVKSEHVSHIDAIIMNPPFSADEKHILHAWEIAPPGCHIRALCNLNTIENKYSSDRKRLAQIVEENGSYTNLGDCFSKADRKTGVNVALVKIQKPGQNYSQEFEGFFLGEDEEEPQENAIMKPNVIREIVNRYVECVKIYDEQIKTAVRLSEMQGSCFSTSYTDYERSRYSDNKGTISVTISADGVPLARNEFKKRMQKSGWLWIFKQMNLEKYSTRQLKEDINKFVEKQTEIPFTMRNIYRMLEIVVGTTEQRMDKALLEVFERLTKHYDENRYNVEGWKTNSHYLVTRRFIFPGGCERDWSGGTVSIKWWTGAGEQLADIEKALCFLSGDNYETIKGFASKLNPEHEEQRERDRRICEQMTPGEWYDTHFFRIRAYKKGTVHCEFNSEDLWAKFNQRIAKLKGYPLFEHTKKEAQKKQQEQQQRTQAKTTTTAKVLFEFQV